MMMMNGTFYLSGTNTKKLYIGFWYTAVSKEKFTLQCKAYTHTSQTIHLIDSY